MDLQNVFEESSQEEHRFYGAVYQYLLEKLFDGKHPKQVGEEDGYQLMPKSDLPIVQESIQAEVKLISQLATSFLQTKVKEYGDEQNRYLQLAKELSEDIHGLDQCIQAYEMKNQLIQSSLSKMAEVSQKRQQAMEKASEAFSKKVEKTYEEFHQKLVASALFSMEDVKNAKKMLYNSALYKRSKTHFLFKWTRPPYLQRVLQHFYKAIRHFARKEGEQYHQQIEQIEEQHHLLDSATSQSLSQFSGKGRIVLFAFLLLVVFSVEVPIIYKITTVSLELPSTTRWLFSIGLPIVMGVIVKWFILWQGNKFVFYKKFLRLAIGFVFLFICSMAAVNAIAKVNSQEPTAILNLINLGFTNVVMTLLTLLLSIASGLLFVKILELLDRQQLHVSPKVYETAKREKTTARDKKAEALRLARQCKRKQKQAQKMTKEGLDSTKKSPLEQYLFTIQEQLYVQYSRGYRAGRNRRKRQILSNKEIII